MDKILYKKIKVTIEKLSFIYDDGTDYEDTFASIEIVVLVPFTAETTEQEIHKRALIVALSNIASAAGPNLRILHSIISYNNITFEEENNEPRTKM